MWWQYLLVFIGSLIVDVTPFPLPPAFTLMIFLQIVYKLNIWVVIGIGVLGSILGRYILTLYIPKISGKLLTLDKNEDVQYLGKLLKHNGWKGQLFIVIYCLMPLPSTPLFIAGGIAKMKPLYIIPGFIVGKFISDTIAVLLGKYAAENVNGILSGMISWKSITGLTAGLFLVMCILFIDWRTLLQKKKLQLRFHVWK
jgi:membrane protein DedA with SNARE-associated domain